MSSSPCCPPNSIPAKSATEAGATTPLIGEHTLLSEKTRAYLVQPKNPIKGSLIVFHDIFGFNGGRTNHICDEISTKCDYLVIAVDFFGESDVVDPGDFLSLSFFSKTSSMLARSRVEFDSVLRKINNEVIPFIRERTSTKIGTLGFCWGGWALTRLAGVPNTQISVGVGAHPSPHLQLLKKGPTMDEMFQKVSVPLLFMPSWNDPPSLRKNGYYMKILQSGKGKGSKSILFRNQIHGWVNRGDIRVESVRKDYDRFMNETIAFLREHLEGIPIKPSKL